MQYLYDFETTVAAVRLVANRYVRIRVGVTHKVDAIYTTGYGAWYARIGDRWASNAISFKRGGAAKLCGSSHTRSILLVDGLESLGLISKADADAHRLAKKKADDDKNRLIDEHELRQLASRLGYRISLPKTGKRAKSA